MTASSTGMANASLNHDSLGTSCGCLGEVLLAANVGETFAVLTGLDSPLTARHTFCFHFSSRLSGTLNFRCGSGFLCNAVVGDPEKPISSAVLLDDALELVLDLLLFTVSLEIESEPQACEPEDNIEPESSRSGSGAWATCPMS